MNRLDTIYSLIKECKVFVDIGCDHGYIARHALTKSDLVVASDISESCLNKAKKLLKNHDNVIFTKSDGLDFFALLLSDNFSCQINNAAQNQSIIDTAKVSILGAAQNQSIIDAAKIKSVLFNTDTFIKNQNINRIPLQIAICGMGGHNIIDIIKNYLNSNFIKANQSSNWHNSTRFILQPQNDAPALRQFLISNGYWIASDIVAHGNGKFYSIILASLGQGRGKQRLDLRQIEFGTEYLTDLLTPLYLKKLLERTMGYPGESNQKKAKKIASILEEINLNKNL